MKQILINSREKTSYLDSLLKQTSYNEPDHADYNEGIKAI